ncbi:unnamed protein product, partial [Staurois parvus]
MKIMCNGIRFTMSAVEGTYFRRWTETAHILQETVRDCKHTTGDGKRLQTYYRRWTETADILQEMVRDCKHTTGNGQRLQRYYRRWSE